MHNKGDRVELTPAHVAALGSVGENEKPDGIHLALDTELESGRMARFDWYLCPSCAQALLTGLLKIRLESPELFQKGHQ